MAQVPEKLSALVTQRVHRDLAPSLGAVYLKSGLAVVLGGTLSLFLCGQFGVAITGTAENFHHHLNESVDSLACALLCGFFFAVIPAGLLRLFSSHLQYKAILKRSFHAPLIWTLGLGAMLAYHGDHGKSLGEFALWLIAAAVTFRALSSILDRQFLGRRQLVLESTN